MSTFKMEWIKLTKRKSTKVLGIIYALILLGHTFIYFYGEKVSGLSIYNEGQFVLSSLSSMMGFLLPFIALYLAAISFGQDFEQGTIKNMFLTPIKKESLFLNKFLSIQAINGVALGTLLVFSMIMSLMFDGGFTIFGTILVEYTGAFIVLGLLAIIGGLISLLIGSTGMTIFISYIGYVVLGFVSLYFPAYRGISLTKIFGNYDVLLTGSGLTLLLSTLAYYIILGVIGFTVFDKKEDKSCQFE